MSKIMLLIAILLTGCATSAPVLPEELAAAIPPGSNTVLIKSDLTTDELFAEARRSLIENGFDFVRYSMELHLISTDQVEIGQSTAIRLTLQAAAAFDGSQLEAAGQWTDISGNKMRVAGPGSSGRHLHWEVAVWNGSERSKLAFGQIARIMGSLPHTEVVYLTK